VREFSSIDPGPLRLGHGEARGSRREIRRNTFLLVLNGGLVFFSMTLVSTDMVLPAFVQTLTSSSVMIGLAGALMRIGWSWPQVFISRRIEPRRRKMPIFLSAGYARSGVWLLLGLLTLWIGGRYPVAFVAAFMVLFAVATSMMGITNVPWMDIIGKAIPSAERARMFSVRRLFGGGMSMLAGVVVSFVLSQRSGLGFPYSYGALFLLSGVGTALSVAAFGRIREPVELISAGRQRLRAYLASGLRLLREDVDYRRLCVLQYSWAFAMMVAPFYIPYAISDLGIAAAYVGVFIAVMQLSSIASNVLWAYVGGRYGSRTLLVCGSYILGLSVAIPLLTTLMPSRPALLPTPWGQQVDVDLRVAFFGLTFFLSGFATSGAFTGRMTYILDIAPADRRPTYTSFMNMFMLPQSVLPVLAGLLVSWFAYRNVFLLALLFSPLSVVAARSLKDVRRGDGDAAAV